METGADMRPWFGGAVGFLDLVYFDADAGTGADMRPWFGLAVSFWVFIFRHLI
jgi:hypothetical protein